MVNCAHPTHLRATLEQAQERDAAWLDRFKGLRTNASRTSRAEFDNSSELDRGEPRTLASEVAALQRDLGLRLLG